MNVIRQVDLENLKMNHRTKKIHSTSTELYQEIEDVQLLDHREIEVRFQHNNIEILKKLLDTYKTTIHDKEKLRQSDFYKIFRKSFDSQVLNMPITEPNLELIKRLFPKLNELILTIKNKHQPERFLFQSLSNFRHLKTLSLHFVNDMLLPFNEPLIKINELKLYIHGPNKYITQNILNTVTKIKSLTILGGNFLEKTTNAIRTEKITRLSIKNCKFEQKEMYNFQNIFFEYKLIILKLVTTNYGTQSYDQTMDLITNYLSILPHKNLKSLSISLPPKEITLNFKHIFETLNKLLIFRIFFTKQNQFNSFEQLKSIIKTQTKKVHIEFVEYDNHTTTNKRKSRKNSSNQLMEKIISNDISYKKVRNPYKNLKEGHRHNKSRTITIKNLKFTDPRAIDIPSTDSDTTIDSDTTVDMNITYANLNINSSSDEEP